MKKYIIALVIVVILIGLAFILSPDFFVKKNKDNTVIFNEYIHKYINFLNSSNNTKLVYKQSMDVDIIKPKTFNGYVELEKSGENWLTKLKSDKYYTWEAGYINGSRWLCLKIGMKKACLKNVLNNQKVAPIFLKLKGFSLTKSFKDKEELFFEELIKNNAITIKNISKEDNCTAFYLNYSLANLPVSSLNKLGYTTTSIPVLINNFNLTLCIDNKGILHKKLLSYKFKDKINKEELLLINRTHISSISFNASDNEGAFAKLYFSLPDLLNYLQKGDEISLRTAASEFAIPQLCSKVKNQSVCAAAYIQTNNDGSVCGYVNKALKDKCYIAAASIINNSSWCNFVSSEMKDQCLNQTG